MRRHPDSTAPQGTVEAFLEDVEAEIAARCKDRGTTYEALVQDRMRVVMRIECAAVHRICGRAPVNGVQQNGLRSFSQTVGDHKWEINYSSIGGSGLLGKEDWKALGLAGQQIGWIGVPCREEADA